MKIPGKVAILLLMLFNAVMVFAETPPQPPPSTAKGAAAAAGPVQPPTVPINGDLLFGLAIAGLILGLYVIYKHKIKASV